MATSFAYLRNALGLAVLITAAPAMADTVLVTREEPARQGFVLGASLDGGNLGCQTKSGDDCGNGLHAAGGFSVHIGGMVTPELAILGEVWGMSHSDDDVTASQVIGTVNVRGWVAPRLWLQGGLGTARSKITADAGPIMAHAMSSTVPAFAAAIGLELVQTRQFGLDVELRGGSGFYRDDVRVYNAALGVGATFF
ncbi:MAG TPA: hypothetical protein VGC42_02675 [Kofleriaceae bacterium]